MALSSPSQAPSKTEGQPSTLHAVPSPRTSAHQTANGTVYPAFRTRPRTAKGNSVIAQASAKPAEKGPVGTALPERTDRARPPHGSYQKPSFDPLFRGNHLSNATCLMQVVFKSDESFCKLW